MTTPKLWKKPTLHVAPVRLAAGATSGPTNDKTNRHAS